MGLLYIQTDLEENCILTASGLLLQRHHRSLLLFKVFFISPGVEDISVCVRRREGGRACQQPVPVPCALFSGLRAPFPGRHIFRGTSPPEGWKTRPNATQSKAPAPGHTGQLASPGRPDARVLGEEGFLPLELLGLRNTTTTWRLLSTSTSWALSSDGNES